MQNMAQNKHKTVQIPMEVFKSGTDREAFFHRVSFFAQNCQTYREAWEQAEKELNVYGFPARYCSYDSFRVMRQKWIKNKG
jgi:hypothetical protein